jgi:hypothetical protein
MYLKNIVAVVFAVGAIGFAAWVLAGQGLLTLPEGNTKPGTSPSNEEILQAQLARQQKNEGGPGGCCSAGAEKTGGCCSAPSASVAKAAVEKKSGCGKDAGSCCCAAKKKPCCCSDDSTTAAAPVPGRGPVPSALSFLVTLGAPGQGPLMAPSALAARHTLPSTHVEK